MLQRDDGLHPAIDPLASLYLPSAEQQFHARAQDKVHGDGVGDEVCDSDDEEMRNFAFAEDIVTAEAAVAEATKRAVARGRKRLERQVSYKMDKDKVLVRGEVCGRISLLMSWTPPSCSATCHKHEDCSVTADMSQSVALAQWVANGGLYCSAQEHWDARPARQSRSWKRRGSK